MSKKEIICVYQDCPLCGDKGKKLKKLIFDKKLNVRKVSFATPEGKDLCYKAVTEHKIGKMPFFTDGVKFTATLKEFIAKKPANTKKTKKTTVKKTTKKGKKDGSDK